MLRELRVARPMNKHPNRNLLQILLDARAARS
jgi:hypothetical protein